VGSIFSSSAPVVRLKSCQPSRPTTHWPVPQAGSRLAITWPTVRPTMTSPSFITGA
jgi:hypothetical protein